MNKTILLKLSGEALVSSDGAHHDVVFMKKLATNIKEVRDAGYNISMVIGGGNICRGEQFAALGIERATADYMGMLATVMNAIAMQSILEEMQVPIRVMSAIPMSSICEPYIRRKAQKYIHQQRTVVIFAAGSGNPFFTTDTAAVLRAVEMNCDLLLKATQVDGVYSADPNKHTGAERFQYITYQEVLNKNLKVMDMAGIALAREHSLPIQIFSVKGENTLLEVLERKGNFTIIHKG